MAPSDWVYSLAIHTCMLVGLLSTYAASSAVKTECPCVVALGDPLHESKPVVDEEACFALCRTYPNCAFFTLDAALSCKVYSQEVMGYYPNAFHNMDCSKTKDSTLKTFKVYPGGLNQTTDCSTIKAADPTSEDGYYDVNIRGVSVSVYCDMDVKKNTHYTLVDLDAYTSYPGAPEGSGPNYEVLPGSRTWSRARVQYDSCMIGLRRDNTEYSVLDSESTAGRVLKGSFPYIWFAFTTNRFMDGTLSKIEVDLAQTPFQFAKGVRIGADKLEKEVEKTSNNTFVSVTMGKGSGGPYGSMADNPGGYRHTPVEVRNAPLSLN